MAVLSDSERLNVYSQFSSAFSARRDSIGTLNKTDLHAAINAIDQWIEDNMASFNAALPENVRTTLTIKQKVEMFKLIVSRKWELG